MTDQSRRGKRQRLSTFNIIEFVVRLNPNGNAFILFPVCNMPQTTSDDLSTSPAFDYCFRESYFLLPPSQSFVDSNALTTRAEYILGHVG